MIIVETAEDLRQQVAHWRGMGERIALVPTMGNLHAGHLQLVRRARELADRVLVSIFVNPLQFGEGEDLDAYPRTLDQDRTRLEAIATDLLFTPPVSEIYHRACAEETRVEVPGLSDRLCGASRPGHFVGVATVVAKLFNLAQPDLALFGHKDYQQLLIIRRMVDDLCVALQIEGVATVREPDGLALSSRNAYLTAEQRRQAPALYRTLQQLAADIQAGEPDYRRLERDGLKVLQDAGLRPDYLQICRAADLLPADSGDRELVVLAAVYLGCARLIDNAQLILE